jgi:hypothetical protein
MPARSSSCSHSREARIIPMGRCATRDTPGTMSRPRPGALGVAMQKPRSAEFAGIPIVVVTVGTLFVLAATAGRATEAFVVDGVSGAA